jgi:hypothetical protein
MKAQGWLALCRTVTSQRSGRDANAMAVLLTCLSAGCGGATVPSPQPPPPLVEIKTIETESELAQERRRAAEAASQAQEAPPPPELEDAPDPAVERAAIQARIKAALDQGDLAAASTLLSGPRPEPDHPQWNALTARLAELQLKAALARLDGALAKGDTGSAMSALSEARALVDRDPALQAVHGAKLQDAAGRVRKQVQQAIKRLAQTAQRGQAPAAAWLYAEIGRSVLGTTALPAGKVDTAAVTQRAAANKAAGLPLLLRVGATDLAKEEAKATGALKAASLLWLAALQTPALQQRLLRVTEGPSNKPAKEQGAWTLDWTIEQFHLQRATVPETRTKKYLDRIETVSNPAWAENHGMAATALAKLNVARDALQPVLDAVNATEARLHQLQTQYAEVQAQIAKDDAEYYKGKPSPCADKSLNCPQTWAYQRWRTNVEYYVGRLAKENAALEELAPKLAALQRKVDEAQAVWDSAQRKAEETPKQVPQEVWLDYKYDVDATTVGVTAVVRLHLQYPAAGKTTELQVLTVRSERRWQDFASPAVIVKGQVLEAEHAATLPDDPSAVQTATAELLAQLLPKVLPMLEIHGQRWLEQATVASTPLQRLDRLVRAWLTRDCLTEEQRRRVQTDILVLSGYDVDRGVLVSGEDLVGAGGKGRGTSAKTK